MSDLGLISGAGVQLLPPAILTISLAPMTTMVILLAVGSVLYLWRINHLMKTVPKEALEASPDRWTRQQVRETYERLLKKPISFAEHLPPKQDRRYVVIGGSGRSNPPSTPVQESAHYLGSCA